MIAGDPALGAPLAQRAPTPPSTELTLEEQHIYACKDAEAKVANAGEAAKRRLTERERELDNFRQLVGRIRSNGGDDA